MKGSDCLQVQDILGKDLVGDEWLTEEELRFLMSVTDEEQLQLIYHSGPMTMNMVLLHSNLVNAVMMSSLIMWWI